MRKVSIEFDSSDQARRLADLLETPAAYGWGGVADQIRSQIPDVVDTVDGSVTIHTRKGDQIGGSVQMKFEILHDGSWNPLGDGKISFRIPGQYGSVEVDHGVLRVEGRVPAVIGFRTPIRARRGDDVIVSWDSGFRCF